MEDNNKKDKTNKTRLEKLINELSTPEAIHASRRMDIMTFWKWSKT